jgi:hypothetical protein
MARACIGIWRINNNLNNTSYDTDSSSISGAASSRTNTVNNLEVGYVGVSILANGNGGQNTTWTNATERFDNLFSGATSGSGADFTATSSGDLTITASATSSSTDGLVLVTAVWN